MTSMNSTELATNMLTAMKGVLAEKWPDIKVYAEAEANKMAQSLLMIQTLRQTGEIDKEEADLHFSIQKNASRTVLLAIEGLGILAVEQAINAALDTVRETVNAAIDFPLI